MRILKTKEERGSLLAFGSVQIGYAAAFGGLVFALRALGIGVPIGPGGMLMDPRDIISIVGPGFSGLIGSIIISILAALPSAVFCVQVYVPLGILWALMFHYLRHPWYYVTLVIGILTAWTASWAFWEMVWGYMPFWVGVTTTFIGNDIVYIPACIIVIEVLRKYSPTAKRLIG